MRGHANLRNSKLSPHQQQLPSYSLHSPAAWLLFLPSLGPGTASLFQHPRDHFPGLLTPPSSSQPAQPPVAQHPPIYPPKAHSHPQRTPTDPMRQKFNKLTCFPGPNPLFVFFLLPSLAKLPHKWPSLLSSVHYPGIAYGNCKASVLIKL